MPRTRAKELFSDDPAAVEYRVASRARSNMGRIFDAVMNRHGRMTGPEAELQKLIEGWPQIRSRLPC